MLSQFSKEGDHPTLADLGFSFPGDAYPVGRLDADSEGLLLLTNERSLNKAMLDPENGHEREYWVQVEGKLTPELIDSLEKGPLINLSGKRYKTRPCVARIIEPAPDVPQRFPPIRFRKTVPDSWLSIALREGKNRQVRKMTAAVGLPTLRLIRVRMGSLELPDWSPGRIMELSRTEFLRSMVDIY